MIQKFDFNISNKDRNDLIKLVKKDCQLLNNSIATTEVTNFEILKDSNTILNQLKTIFNQYTNNCFDLISHENYKFDFYLTKSWGTFSDNLMQGETFHHHGYCNFAFVFYLVKPNNSNIIFQDSNSIKFEVEANENEIIIFPGYYNHCIQNNSQKERLSIAGDIIMTLQPNQPAWEFLPPVNRWTQL